MSEVTFCEHGLPEWEYCVNCEESDDSKRIAAGRELLAFLRDPETESALRHGASKVYDCDEGCGVRLLELVARIAALAGPAKGGE